MISLKKPMKILLVEDNILNQKLMYFNLSKMGFDISMVSDGNQAVNACKNSFYDIILMDIMMPFVDGYEATKQIRTLQEGTSQSYIIGLTANVFDSDRDKCLKSGMDNFMPKPFDIDFFCNILEKQSFI